MPWNLFGILFEATINLNIVTNYFHIALPFVTIFLWWLSLTNILCLFMDAFSLVSDLDALFFLSKKVFYALAFFFLIQTLKNDCPLCYSPID